MSTKFLKFEWTPERVAQVMEMNARGMTSGEIAKILGTTCNSIIGRITRERIKNGYVPKKRESSNGAQRGPRTRNPGLVSYAANISEEECQPVVIPMITKGTGKPCSIVEVCGCKWPLYDDPKAYGGVIFCNEPRPANMPYCAAHRKVAGEKYRGWTPDEDRRVRHEWKGGRGTDLLAQVLRRTKAAVINRARHLGLAG